MVVLIFFIGALLGMLMGGALCVRYLRHEVAADIAPRLQHIQLDWRISKQQPTWPW